MNQQSQQIQSNTRVNLSSSDNEISNDIKKTLESKSIEELMYINFNQEEFINDYTQKYSTNMNELLNETSTAAGKVNFVKLLIN